jgi:hypothetical protein
MCAVLASRGRVRAGRAEAAGRDAEHLAAGPPVQVGRAVFPDRRGRPADWSWLWPAGFRGAPQAGLRLMARSGLRKDATYVGQIMAPWQRKLTTPPSATSKDSFRLE